ncbi:MAG: hypothetical protein LH649_01040 [Pseudanabaena sp. CAN_BIN31]|nr:hypothetical protein [Pseudanabaena sp. CAN_BIN31]
MQALKVMASVNEKGELILDYPLQLKTNSRVELIVLISETEEIEEPSKQEIIDDFRQSWHEAMTGQTIPISEVWAQLAND